MGFPHANRAFNARFFSVRRFFENRLKRSSTNLHYLYVAIAAQPSSPSSRFTGLNGSQTSESHRYFFTYPTRAVYPADGGAGVQLLYPSEARRPDVGSFLFKRQSKAGTAPSTAASGTLHPNESLPALPIAAPHPAGSPFQVRRKDDPSATASTRR